MPQATDLVIKNGAGTPVDKTFTLMAPAAGDDAALAAIPKYSKCREFARTSGTC